MGKDKTMELEKKNKERRQLIAMLVIAGLIAASAAAFIFFGHLLVPLLPGIALAGPLIVTLAFVVLSWAWLNYIYYVKKPKHKQGYFVKKTRDSKGKKKIEVNEISEDKKIKEGFLEIKKGLIAENKNIKRNKFKSKSKGLVRFNFFSASEQRVSIGFSAIGASLIVAGVVLYRPEILGAMTLAIGLNPIIAISIIAVGGILLVGGAYCFAKFRLKHFQDLKNNTEKIIDNTFHDIVNETVSNKTKKANTKNINVAIKNDNDKEKIQQNKNRYHVPLNKRTNFNTDGRIVIMNPLNQVNRSLPIPIPKKIELISKRYM